MGDLTELDPDDLREQLHPEVEGVSPDDLSVGELRYAARVHLDRGTDQRPLRRGDLVAAYEACCDHEAEDEWTVSEIRYNLGGVLPGVASDAHAGATALTREILVPLVEELAGY